MSLNPPKTLEELLHQIEVPDTISSSTVDEVIMNNYWTNKFSNYLSLRQLYDDETILRFLVMDQPIFLHRNSTTFNLENLRSLFVDICDTFLTEESENVLPLSNQVLLHDLLETADIIKSGLPVTVSSILYINMVRKDPGIWDEGIEPTYYRFLKQMGEKRRNPIELNY